MKVYVVYCPHNETVYGVYTTYELARDAVKVVIHDVCVDCGNTIHEHDFIFMVNELDKMPKHD